VSSARPLLFLLPGWPIRLACLLICYLSIYALSIYITCLSMCHNTCL
jgi:hypothetical protein